MNLHEMTDEELKSLNHRVVTEMRFRHREKGRQVAATIAPGQTVTFNGKLGTVTKVNRTTAIVRDASSHMNWRVSLSLIKPFEAASI